MTRPAAGWRDLFVAGGGATIIFISGVALQAMEAFIGTAMLPTVVGEIGGLELFAWNATLFVVASILGSMLASVRPGWIGPRLAYVGAALGFALGSVVCGLAPDMPILLVGRTIQGFGAGVLVAVNFGMLRIIFPQHLWPRAFALTSSVWGIATILGPAVGGAFAELGIWRWAFLGMVPVAGLLALAAARILPARAETRAGQRAPVAQIALVCGAVLATSIASTTGDRLDLAAFLVVLALGQIALVGFIDRRAAAPLLPAGTFSRGTAMGTLFAGMVLLNLAITSDIFAPLLLQRIEGLSPLAAGYLTALVAGGWSIGAILTSGWSAPTVRRAIAASPVVILVATLGLLAWVDLPGLGAAGLPLAAASLALLGLGIGSALQHFSSRIIASAHVADNNRVSGAVSTAQLFAAGLGAAIGGLAVNFGGLPQAVDAAGVRGAGHWLFVAFALIAALAIPPALRAASLHPLRPAASEGAV